MYTQALNTSDADDRHVEVRTTPPAEALREVVAEEAGGVGPPAHLAEQRLPLLVREPVAVPVGPAVLPPVVEEPLVVVLGLERRDLVGDEAIEVGEEGDEVLRQREVHGRGP